MSQQQLANALNVERSTVAGWETGRRAPDIETITRIAALLDVKTSSVIDENEETAEKPLVMMVDDEKLILEGSYHVLKLAIPKAEIVGFTRPSDAIEFAKTHKVDIALLDIEMGKTSGLDLCRTLIRINKRTNVIYLTAYAEYSFDAWSTGASGFIVKPPDVKSIRTQLSLLRYPVKGIE